MKIAILGFGTVGQGVYNIIEKNKKFENSLVLVRKGKKKESFQVEDINSIVSDKSISTVVECMGGTDEAYSYVKLCLENGKNVVTPNKALVAKFGKELQSLAEKNSVAFLFSASCGGAIPVLHNIQVASDTDTINRAGGILNGTTNFILTKMQNEGKDYLECLKEAQNLGYAEADPTSDVSGLDTMRKVLLISAVAFGKLPISGYSYEGIENFTSGIAKDLAKRGKSLRLMGVTGKINDSVYAYVEPIAVNKTDIEASIDKNVNFAFYEAENSGRITLSGQGAGRYPTASAVLRDLTAIKEGCKKMFVNGVEEIKASNKLAVHNYYINIDGKTEIKENISVEEMHINVQNLRKRGSKVFFAEYR